MALFYNKEAFRQKNLSPPKNWTELERCVKILNSNKMSGIYIPIQPDDYQNFIFYTFLMQSGRGVINEATGKSQFAAYSEKALNLWRNLAKYNYNIETSIQSPADINPLASEKAAIQICGYWAVNALEKFYPNFKYGVAKVPYPEDGHDTSVYGGWFQAVNPGSKNAAEAAKFALWMWGENASRPMEWCTEASTKFPARKSVVEKYANLFNSRESKIFKDNILPGAVPEPRYPVEIANAVSKAIQDAMFTNKDIKTIAKDSDKAINNYLKLNKNTY